MQRFFVLRQAWLFHLKVRLLLTIIFNSLMMVDNISKTTQKKAVTTVTKHIEKYLTTQFQTHAMNNNYTDLQNALSHALYLIK